MEGGVAAALVAVAAAAADKAAEAAAVDQVRAAATVPSAGQARKQYEQPASL